MNEDFNLEPAIEPVTAPPTSESAVPIAEEAARPEVDNGGATTGLAWPKTWRGAYVLVVCSFVLWVVSLIAVSEVFK